MSLMVNISTIINLQEYTSRFKCFKTVILEGQISMNYENKSNLQARTYFFNLKKENDSKVSLLYYQQTFALVIQHQNKVDTKFDLL